MDMSEASNPPPKDHRILRPLSRFCFLSSRKIESLVGSMGFEVNCKGE
jgi:hypothetical protein